MPETLLSARDLSCSDQLNPWSEEPGEEPPGARMERMALAPKLIRRTKGVVGAVRVEFSSSSMAFSSMESELLVEILPRLIPPNAPPVAEAGGAGPPPDRPRVVTERRRRGSLAAAADDIWLPFEPVEMELLRWKRLENAAEVTEPRRSREPEGGLLSRSLDMLAVLMLVVMNKG